MDIRILPSNIANMIAAGEVVQRPASVVKELVENAVDAGADQITVVIQDAGRTLIQVIDNGCGMSPDQAVLCFERHATSKLSSAEDLNNILTFGFRGEALASIAAVAEVTLKTRREEDELGCIVEFADSRHIDTREAAVPRGASFSVRNLFYNVPARRKFLKSDNVEFKHIISEFTRVALTRPEIGFTLTHNGRDIYVLKPAKSLKYRIQDILGPNVANDVVDVDVETSVVGVHGYAGRPDAAKKGLGNQYFFVNGRYFRSPYLHKAVMKAYESLVPDGLTPSYFLYLTVDPHSVDVNIHPTKTEIKFEDDNVIFQILFACVKESLGKNSFGSSLDFDREGVPEIPAFSKGFEEFRPVNEPRAVTDAAYNPFDNDGFPSVDSPFTNTFLPGMEDALPAGGAGIAADGLSAGGFGAAADGMPAGGFGVAADGLPAGISDGTADENFRKAGTGHSGTYPEAGHFIERHDDYGKLFEDRLAPSKAVLTLQGKYIVASARSGLMIINIARAMERILYERFLDVLSKNSHVTQTALFPVSVCVGAENMCLFAEHEQLLSGLGFDIAPFGTDTVVVGGVPEGYSVEPGKVQAMVSDLVFILSDDHSALTELMTANMASKFAKLGASGSDPVTNPAQAQRLIDQLFACGNAEYTSSGRKIVTIISAEEIERKF